MRLRILFIGCLCVLSLAASCWGQVGQLSPVAPGKAFPMKGEQLAGDTKAFGKPLRGGGTVHPNAIIARLNSGRTRVAVAIDARTPGTRVPDVFRLDFTGKGRFDNECVVPLVFSNSGQYTIGKIGPAVVTVQRDGVDLSVRVSGQYTKYGRNRDI